MMIRESGEVMLDKVFIDFSTKSTAFVLKFCERFVLEK